MQYLVCWSLIFFAIFANQLTCSCVAFTATTTTSIRSSSTSTSMIQNKLPKNPQCITSRRHYSSGGSLSKNVQRRGKVFARSSSSVPLEAMPTVTMEDFTSSTAANIMTTTTTMTETVPLSVISSSSDLIGAASSNPIMSTILTNENISIAFNVATFGPQILWLLIILLPSASITKKVMGSYLPIITFSLVHLFIVIASALQENGTAPLVEFNDVFDPSGNPQLAMVNMMKYPNFVSEEWSHVLTWDLFVGRMVWLDGLRRGIFTGHSVLFCNLIGPPGFLMHCVTCLLTGKGFLLLENEALEEWNPRKVENEKET